jgi:hypothetical protein
VRLTAGLHQAVQNTSGSEDGQGFYMTTTRYTGHDATPLNLAASAAEGAETLKGHDKQRFHIRTPPCHKRTSGQSRREPSQISSVFVHTTGSKFGPVARVDWCLSKCTGSITGDIPWKGVFPSTVISGQLFSLGCCAFEPYIESNFVDPCHGEPLESIPQSLWHFPKRNRH